MQNYDYGYSKSDTQQFVGEVLGRNSENGLIEIDVKNKFLVGDELELMTPSGNMKFTLTHMESSKGGSHFRCKRLWTYSQHFLGDTFRFSLWHYHAFS